MANRNKEDVLLPNRSTLNETTTGIKRRCKSIWLLIKQVWYIPFLWSLAWFSYWIFYSVIVSNQLLTQVNPLNYVGIAISIGALLIAGYISGKSINKKVVEKISIIFNLKKIFSFRKTRNEKKARSHSLTQKFMPRNKVEQPKPLKPQINHASIIEQGQIQTPYEPIQEPVQVSATPRVLASQSKHPDQTRESQEIGPECLVCPNLVNCTHRQNRIIDSETPCPFATNLQKSRAS